VGVAEFQEQAAHGNGVHVADSGFADQRAGRGVQRPEDAVALPAGAGGNDPADAAPEVGEEGAADEVGGVDEEDASLVRDGFFNKGCRTSSWNCFWATGSAFAGTPRALR